MKLVPPSELIQAVERRIGGSIVAPREAV